MKTVEVVYLITSADRCTALPATLAAWVQRHWMIDNTLHWVRDVTYDGDRPRHAAHVMATLRSAAISILRFTGWDKIATDRRHHSRNPERATTCALTC
ncbi:hypothetical protein SDC9_127514 [bioreactor metagenome]|uniref:Transposase IS4-like domain-containing protein n=1 Tax=bioreactor metagenome TaxID=1076179 RepID=A0A645CU68_9ZZZZ